MGVVVTRRHAITRSMDEYANVAVALREWGAVVTALGQGLITAVVRKGGIHEHRGGLFTLRHQRFALLPAVEHQATERLAPALRDLGLLPPPPSGQLEISHWATVVDHWQLNNRQQVAQAAAMPGLQGLSEGELAARFAYRDQPWVSVLLVAVSAFAQPQHIPDQPQYGGCRSWIALQAALPLAGSRPVCSASRVQAMREQLTQCWGHGAMAGG